MSKRAFCRLVSLGAALAVSSITLMPCAALATDYNWSTGIFVPGGTAPEPLKTPDVLEINAGGNKFFSGGITFTNESGFVKWNVDSLFFQNGATVKNQGEWDAKSDNNLANNGGALSTFNNSGTFRKALGSGTTLIGTIQFINSGTIDAQVGTINFGGGNVTFNNGTQFTGTGTNLVSSNANFNDTITSGNLLLQSGTYSGNSVVLNGATNFSGGAFVGTWQLPAGQLINALGGGNKFLSSATLTNKGTVQWQADAPLFLQNGSTVDNQGAYNMLGNTSLTNNGGLLPTFINSGTLFVADGKSSSVGTIAFVNNAGTIEVGAGGLLSFTGGNVTFNAGTVLGGSGVVAITNNATFNGAFNSSNLSLRNGAYTGNSAQSSGAVEFTAGALSGGWDTGGATWTVKSGPNKFLNSASFTNHSTVNYQTADSLFLQNGSTFLNFGLLDYQSGASLVNNGGVLPTFDNRGTVRVDPGQNSSVGTIAFVNNGAVIDVGAGGSMTFAGGNVTFNAGTVLGGAGVTILTSNGTFNGAFNASNLSLRAGTYTGNAAALSGVAEISAGVLQGSWTIDGGSTLNLVSGANKFLNSVTLTNQGTLAWKAPNSLFFQNSANIVNQGLIDLQTDAAMVFNGGVLGSILNTGLITKSAGAGTSTIGNSLGFDNHGIVDVETGTLRLPDNFTNNGTLKGIGTFQTNTLANAGHVAPGSSPGILKIIANFSQTSAGTFDVELENLLNADLLTVNGTATLNGTLALSCFDGCSFAVGDEVVILASSGALTGTFSNVTKSGFATGNFDVIYDTPGRRVLLRVTEAVTPLPEPAAAVVLLIGSGLMLARRRRSLTAA